MVSRNQYPVRPFGAPSALLIVLFTLPSICPGQQIHDVTVTGTDYAFGVPIIDRGLTAFSFENRGQVRHEMLLVRLKVGVTPDSLMRANPGRERRNLMEGGGLLIAEPGQRTLDRLLADLLPGRTYMLLCNLRDQPDQPQHVALGMFASFQAK